MNIEISDEILAKTIEQELLKITNAPYAQKSHLEQAVQRAISEMARVKVIELIKSDPQYTVVLNTLIETSIIAAFELVAKRIAKDLGESIVSAIEGEFRSYSD
jgi:hypothetical protein